MIPEVATSILCELGENHRLSVPLVQDEDFKLPFRPALFVCSVRQMWQRVSLAAGKCTAPSITSSLRGPEVLLEN